MPPKLINPRRRALGDALRYSKPLIRAFETQLAREARARPISDAGQRTRKYRGANRNFRVFSKTSTKLYWCLNDGLVHLRRLRQYERGRPPQRQAGGVASGRLAGNAGTPVTNAPSKIDPARDRGGMYLGLRHPGGGAIVCVRPHAVLASNLPETVPASEHRPAGGQLAASSVQFPLRRLCRDARYRIAGGAESMTRRAEFTNSVPHQKAGSNGTRSERIRRATASRSASVR